MCENSAIPVSDKAQQIKALCCQSNLYLGIDIGSISSDLVILADSGELLYSDYRRSNGRVLETAQEQLNEIFNQIDRSNIKLSAVTGSAGRLLAQILQLEYINEVPAQAAGIAAVCSDIDQASVIDMGGQDSKLLSLAKENGKIKLRDFSLNTGCAAGTGSFLDQQAARLGVDIENEFAQLALQSKSVPRMAGRCSVFAKSDMIHLQQQATPMCDIIAGLCLALAVNLRGNLAQGREWIKPIIFTGGVAANIGVVKAIESAFELQSDELIVPKEHFFTGAIGAVKVAIERLGEKAVTVNTIGLEKIDDYLSKRGESLQRAPRRPKLPAPSMPAPQSKVYSELIQNAKKPIDAYIGVDVGSISTNVVVMDVDRRVLAKAYLMTAGKPLEAVREGMRIVGDEVAAKVNIIGAATTGSGRYLTGDFVGADTVINEITAQAAGAAIVVPDVDTIFEIGGQDSKYISLENGVVVDFEMNHACAAGTGSFLEEQAQRLNISINKEFADRAFAANNPIKLGERCTVFMESDLINYQQQGAECENLVAGLSYSIVANYLNRVVGRRKLGEKICFQGGTAFNRAVVAAFEQVVGKPITVPDHHEVTGALGAAAIAADYMSKHQGISKSKFRGFENLASAKYKVESFECKKCSNNCKIKKVTLAAGEALYYGSRCDIYNVKHDSSKKQSSDAFEYRTEKLFEYARIKPNQKQKNSTKPTVGLPLSLINWQFLPLMSRFFQELGFEVIVSEQTNKSTIRKGVEKVTAQTCFPVKVAYGHTAELIEKGVDYIFTPSIISLSSEFPENKHNKCCPYVQSFAYQARSQFAEQAKNTKILDTPIRLGEGKKHTLKTFRKLAAQAGAIGGNIESALDKALQAQRLFEQSLKTKGRQIIDALGEDEKLFILVSRPYNGCDDGVNLELPRKLAAQGAKIIPMDMLELTDIPLTDELLHKDIYWGYGQKILRAAELIKTDKRLYAIYLSNFSCGPDSFIQTFFKDIMGDKPCLQLEIDEHSADAGVITRIEAFIESLKNYIPAVQPQKQKAKFAAKNKVCSNHTLYIPYMSDASYALAAAFRGIGQPAKVLPIADEKAMIYGRAYTTGKECLPCAITTGDMIKVIKQEGLDSSNAAFFMPSSSGPCRFGMYNCLHRLVLTQIGLPDISILNPNQDSKFYQEFGTSVSSSKKRNIMKDLWSGVAATDLLIKTIHKIRPFANQPQVAQAVYDKYLGKLENNLENGCKIKDLQQLMAMFAEELKKLPINSETKKPVIGIVGEIYVRNHPFANLNLIERLEQLGAVVELASLSEWIYYTNYVRKLSSIRRNEYNTLLANTLQDFYQKTIEKTIAKPLEAYLGRLRETPTKEILSLAKPYLDPAFEGEAILSIGKMVELHHQGAAGVINVMPFSCMPSTVVSTQTMLISKKCNDMPILNLSFDGQEDPILLTKLEAFVEQVRSRI